MMLEGIHNFTHPHLILADFWVWQFLGRLHPLVVHFPIGLIFAAFAMEFLTSTNRRISLRGAIDFLLKAGAATAVLAGLFGWLLQSQESYGGNGLTIHLWLGVATGVLSLVTSFVLHRALHDNRVDKFPAYRIMLFITVAVVSITGHYGASLTHGSDYLTTVLPWNQTESNFDLASLKSESLSEEQISALNLEVRSIFAHNCYRCHSSQKEKAELRLDKKEFVMKGGESGPVIIAGHPEKSEMIRRLLLPRDHKESMPPEGKTVSPDEIEILQRWIQVGAPWPDNAEQKSVYRVASLAPRIPLLPTDPGGLEHPIDRFVNAYFEKEKIEWPALVDDRTFLRRVYLDITGLIPSPGEVDSFLADQHTDKREQVVEELLKRNDDYAQHWLTFWNDALRNDYSGTGYITGGRFAITPWLYNALKENKPYDVFVRELISPDKRSEGFIRGIQWRGTVNASQRIEMQAAQNISQVFLGLNLKCASCHDSFISDWKLKDAYAFANIFSDTTLEINRCDKPTGELAGTKVIFTELGTIDSTRSVEEKLKQLSVYLTSPKNGRLYRTIVNRVWAQMMGRGMVEPVDVMDNEPWSQDLLDWLASDFADNGKDIKRLIRMIAISKTYQLPTVVVKEEIDLLASDYVFRGMHLRRLSAEQFTDAVSAVVSPVYPDSVRQFSPEKSTMQSPRGNFIRAVLARNDPYLTALGRPNRENVSTSRSSQASLLQALELTNGHTFSRTIESGAQYWVKHFSSDEAMITEVYRTALGRVPNDSEMKAAVKTIDPSAKAESVEDLLWALMLVPEFQLIY